jgi:HEPN domain-containing protein
MSTPSESLEIALAWLRKAANDLEAARRILAIPDGCPFDTVCFHCQQAAEKALKAWMTLNGQAAPRTHDLEPLFQAAVKTLTGLPPLEEIVALNPYGVQVQYLDEWLEPSEQDARSALDTAQAVYLEVRTSLPDEGK